MVTTMTMALSELCHTETDAGLCRHSLFPVVMTTQLSSHNIQQGEVLNTIKSATCKI